MAGMTTAGVLAAISAASAVVSLAMTLSMRPEDAKDNGVDINRKGTNNPKIVPFGNCRVPCVKVWNNVNNTNVRYLAQAYAIGVGEIRAVKNIYIDGVAYRSGLEEDKWYGFKSSGEFPNAALGIRLGKATEKAYPEIIEHSDGEWTEYSRGDRTASISMLVHREINEDGDNNIRIVSDMLEIEALVQGVAVIDPRRDPSLEGIPFHHRRVWSSGGQDYYRNPALVLFTYLVDTYYGMGIPASAIDVKSFVDLANYCERVNIYFDGYVDQNSSFGDILKDMVTSFDGIVYVEDGMVRVKADRETTAITHISESECVGSFKLSNASESSYYNIVNVEYINSATYYAKDKYVLPTDVSLIHQRDGFEKVKDMKMLYTSEQNGVNFVRHVANKALKKAHYQRTIEFELDNTKKTLGIWDVFTISNDAYKLDKAMFRVDKVVTSLDEKTMITKVTATQYEPRVYDGSDYEDGDHSNPVAPPTNQILEPVSLEFIQTGSGTTGSGTLSWTPRYMKEHKACIEYKLVSAPTWTRVGEFAVTSYNFVNLPHDTYDFRVRTVAYSGSTSPWAILENVEITSDILMPTVTGLTGDFTTQDCCIKWDDMTQVSMGGNSTYAEVFSHYEVQIYKGRSESYAATYQVTANHFNYLLSMNQVDGSADRRVTFKVLMVSTDGVKSQGATKLHMVNAQCTQPSGVHTSGVFTSRYAKWDQPSELDYLGSEIHVSTDPVFTPSSSTLVGLSKGEAFPIEMGKGNYYLRVGHYDVFGGDGIAYCDPVFFTSFSVDDVLEDTPAWEDMTQEINGIKHSVSDVNASVESMHGLITDVAGNVEAITQIKHTVDGKVSGLIMGNDGETSNFTVIADNFMVSEGAGSKAVFQIVDGQTTIKEAMIGKLSADHIDGGSISGNSITCNTKIIAGQGGYSATLDGYDSNWRIYSGHSVGASAPFRVRKDGYVHATNAHIEGHIVAKSGTFSGTLNVKSASSGTRMEIKNDQINVYEGSVLRVRIGKLSG